jgi:hypothetical protein
MILAFSFLYLIRREVVLETEEGEKIETSRGMSTLEFFWFVVNEGWAKRLFLNGFPPLLEIGIPDSAI